MINWSLANFELSHFLQLSDPLYHLAYRLSQEQSNCGLPKSELTSLWRKHIHWAKSFLFSTFTGACQTFAYISWSTVGNESCILCRGTPGWVYLWKNSCFAFPVPLDYLGIPSKSNVEDSRWRIRGFPGWEDSRVCYCQPFLRVVGRRKALTSYETGCNGRVGHWNRKALGNHHRACINEMNLKFRN